MPELGRIVISNTTPIISLAIIGKLDLLQQMYGEISIPAAVEVELLAGGSRFGAAELLSAGYIHTQVLDDSWHADLLSDLDRGEAEVIALAIERNAYLVIIDERLGRRHAQRLGLSVTGVLGVLLKAKQQGYLAEIKPYIDQLRQNGIYLGDAIINRTLSLAEEN